MTNSEMRSSSVLCETNGRDQTTPEHVTVASVSLSVLLKAKNSFYKFSLVPSHISLVPVPLPLVPGSTTFAQCCTRYHPSGTMAPLPCHPPSLQLLLQRFPYRVTFFESRNKKFFPAVPTAQKIPLRLLLYRRS